MFFKVRELPENFEICQGNFFCGKMSEKSAWSGNFEKDSNLFEKTLYSCHINLINVSFMLYPYWNYVESLWECCSYQALVEITLQIAVVITFTKMEAAYEMFSYVKSFLFQHEGKICICQGNVREKARNYDIPVLWQPCIG